MPHALKHLEHFLWLLLNSKDFWQTTVATAFGALIGGWMASRSAIKAQKQASKDQRERDAQVDRRSVHGTLRAIAAELRILKSHLLDPFQQSFEDREHFRELFRREPPLLRMTPGDPNRFTVFESNNAKGLVDYTNTAARDFALWRHLPDGDEEKKLLRDSLDTLEKRMKSGVSEVQHDLDLLLNEIEQYLKQPNKAC